MTWKFKVLLALMAVIFVILMAASGISAREDLMQRYEQGLCCMDSGDYAQAWETFLELGGYKDSPSLAAEAKELMHQQWEEWKGAKETGYVQQE